MFDQFPEMQSELGYLLSLIPKETTDEKREKNWRHFGEAYGIDQRTLDGFKLAYLSLVEYPGDQLLRFLLTKHPDVQFREIIRILHHIQRKDIIKDTICKFIHQQS